MLAWPFKLRKTLPGKSELNRPGTTVARNFCQFLARPLILVHCRATPRRMIWRLAKGLWPHEQTPWPEITLGTILGCGTITTPEEEHQEEHDRRENRAQRSRERAERCTPPPSDHVV